MLLSMKQTRTQSSKIVADTIKPVEEEILLIAQDHPELGQAAVAMQLEQSGIAVSASGVRYIWKKHNLETAVKRLQAITVASEQGAAVLTGGQQRLLERGLLSHRLIQEDMTEEQEAKFIEQGTGEQLGRRTIILNVAADLFSKQGYDGTSIRKIAQQAGLLPGSVYHHFASKEDLYITVIKEGLRGVAAAVQAAVAGSTDPWERLELAFTVHVANMVGASTPIQRLTGHSLALTGHPGVLAETKEERDAYENMIRQLIEDLPLAARVDKTMLRLFLLGATNWVYLWYQEDKRKPEEIVASLVDMVRLGVE